MPTRLPSHNSLTRAALAALLFLSLFVRLAVPAGWMPVRTADGVRLMLCGGMTPAPKPMAHGRDHAAMPHHAPDEPDRPQQPCAFTGVALAVAEPFVPPLPLPAPVERITAAAIPPAVAIGRGLAAPPPPSTGPPLPA